MKKERDRKVYGQKCVSTEPEQNPEQSTSVHQSFKLSMELKAFPERKKANGKGGKKTT